MARIYFISGVKDDKFVRGKSHPHSVIFYNHLSNYPKGIDDTLKIIRKHMEKDDFISITISRDCHTERDNGKIKGVK